jgi:hypothetical protein
MYLVSVVYFVFLLSLDNNVCFYMIISLFWSSLGFILTKQIYMSKVRVYVDWPSLISGVVDMHRDKNNPPYAFTFGSYVRARVCVFALSLLLLMFNRGSHQTYINIKEMHSTLRNCLTPFRDVWFPHYSIYNIRLLTIIYIYIYISWIE